MVTKIHIANCRKLVYEGLQRNCSRLNLEINDEDSLWIQDSHGKFPFFVHPKSNHYNRHRVSKRHINKTLVEINNDYYINNHQKIGPSPRFQSHTAPNHYYNLEQQTSMFWDFLAVIGDYESMIFLLPSPPKNCPGVNNDSIKNILYKFLPKDDPLAVDQIHVETFQFTNN